MRRHGGFFNMLLCKHRRAPVAAAVLAPALLFTGTVLAASTTPVSLKFTIPVKVASTNALKGMFSFDISYVDQTTQTLYVADRSNQAVDVFDAHTGTFTKFLPATPAFAGAQSSPELSGPNGVVTTSSGCIIATDAGGRVVAFNPSGTQASSITLNTGPGRADELAYDPVDNVLLINVPVPNGSANPPAPYGNIVRVSASCGLTFVRTVPYANATNGAEQPVWDSMTHLFYQAIPQVGTNPMDGAVLSITRTGRVVHTYPVKGCQPAGNALNTTTHELLLGCSVVFDTAGGMWSGGDVNTAAPIQLGFDPSTGATHTIAGVGASDEVAYSSFDDHFYTGSSSSPYAPHAALSWLTLNGQGAAILGIIDGTSLAVDQLAPTFLVPTIHNSSGVLEHAGGSAHSVDVNDTNGWVFVPVPANNALPKCLTGCVMVFER